MTEIARTHSGRDHQEVVLEFSRTYSRAIHIDVQRSHVDALNLAQQYAEVFLFRLELPDRRRYLGWRQNSGGELIKKRPDNIHLKPRAQRQVENRSLRPPPRPKPPQ